MENNRKLQLLLLGLGIFLIAFAATYIILCFMVPDLRIKLAAPPLEYFIESLKSCVPLKAGISAAAGLVFSVPAVWITAKS